MNTNINDREMNYIIEELTQFTRSAFDLVKPLIVRNREVNLCIRFYSENNDINTLGSKYLNNVEIYLSSVICRHWLYYSIYEINEFINNCKNSLLFTILHELYHVEQMIHIRMYTINEYYKEQIENQVDYMTCIFIQQHTKYLEDNLNITINLNSISTNLHSYLRGYIVNSYKRHNKISYYENLLDTIIPKSNRDSYSLVKYKLLVDEESSIYLTCNSVKYVIKHNGLINEDFYSLEPIEIEVLKAHSAIDSLGYENIMRRYLSVFVNYDEINNIIMIELLISIPEMPLLRKM